VYAVVLEKLVPAAWHRADRYANNRKRRTMVG